ncbi:hypothetical protein SLS55_008431 [Diplodia seriata]|uniref:FAD-binding PCMH-type domain-containing protein n=1 Tax=Diplodia seriata TaxID=420778 RepID=A0ABR3CAG7_9PEZI
MQIALISAQTYIAAVHPANEQDVASTVRYSHMRGIGCTARSGGHCVTNYMKKLQDGIVVDMRFVNHLSYDAENELVTAGGGVYSGDFAKFIHDRKRELGKCSDIPSRCVLTAKASALAPPPGSSASPSAEASGGFKASTAT